MTSATAAASDSPATASDDLPPGGPTIQQRRRSMLASAVGNGLEWFDWNIAVVFSGALSAALFDPSDPTSALLSLFAVLGVGFLFRPLGGILSGWLADRWGRRTVMVATMLTMSAASLAIALLPTFEQAGVLASVLLLVARLLQGLAHGAESTAGYAYIAEIAPRRRRGLWSSTLAMGVLVGSILASAMGFGLNSTLGVEAVAEWAWRIPFAVGAVLAIVALILRVAMIESDVLRTAQAEGEVGPEADVPASADDRRDAVRSGVKVFFFVALISIAFYTWLTSASTLATAQHGMDPASAFASSLVAQLVCVAVMPFAGILSDRIGRRPVALIFTGGFVLLTAPLTLLISEQAWTLLVAQTLALVLVACGNGIYSALLSEQFRTRHRARGIGIANSLSVAIFGGTALYVNLWLSSIGASWLYIVYVSLVAVAASIAVLRMRETKGVDLRA